MSRAITLRLSDELANDVRLAARLDGVSGAALLRKAIEIYVQSRLSAPGTRTRLAAMQTAERQRLRPHDA
ncbi:hypothetical protein Q5424_17430 [Conexibacter sp. JD483]|uniref:hypothetical protein n=1 Tax=unclassified Conexibacter TaxID=2627773 RepID=UPI0027192455|nr:MULTISPECIES: hypothetical protein [unclassified Conexibacter]MDO8186473.1 hypothetical protein [Conexibacter sp. CPCC 205706]MDO8200042.1 hypothetical protein [Conexibacter sp. CPCC 205762]MDR9370882.1 hypothetical protein [Conexibacter sp. JD483]